MEQKQEKTQEKPQTRQGYQPIDESSINWQELKEKWGIDREELEKSGDLQKMLNYGKSDLVKVSPKFGEETFELDARLSFRKTRTAASVLYRISSARNRNLTNTKDTSSRNTTKGT